MVTVKDEGIILEPTNLSFEKKAVSNPGCIEVDGIVHMFYRAVGTDNISSIGKCLLQDNKVISRANNPILFPEYEYEKQGLEDPRIILLENTYYLLYTVFDGQNARIAYAVSSDLTNFEKKGIISPNITYDEAVKIFHEENLKEEYFIWRLALKKEFRGNSILWEKDGSLFPKKINNNFVLLHRIRPDMQIIYFKSFSDLTNQYWKTYLKNLKKYIVLEPKFWFENQYIGGGSPPIETSKGWLIFYHGVENYGGEFIYNAGVALLDKEDPTKEIGRLNYPLFSPKEIWEKKGVVNNVVFPSGAVTKEGHIYIYYGAADKCIAVKSIELEELLNALKSNDKF